EHLMEHEVIPYLRRKYALHGIIKARLLHTAGAGESQIDDLIGDLEQLSNPTVGLAAHSGQVDVRITAKANSEAEADQMIARIEVDVRQRLGDWIYGADEESLQGVAIQTLHDLGWRLVVIEAGLSGELIGRLSAFGPPFLGGETLSSAPSREELQAQIERYRLERQAEVGLAVAISPGPEKQDIFLTLVTPMGVQQHNRPYGGPPQNAVGWASNHSLNLIRNLRKDVP
ncbi:MAG TPA: hypothetical protein VLS48_06050, partial [Anaerolineales bacterium]|nr:hypothetical protein [Anaerolineales bacterium]